MTIPLSLTRPLSPSPPLCCPPLRSFVSRFSCALNSIQHKQHGANCSQSLLTFHVHIQLSAPIPLVFPFLCQRPVHQPLPIVPFEFWLCSLARNQKMTKAMSTASARARVESSRVDSHGVWAAKEAKTMPCLLPQLV